MSATDTALRVLWWTADRPIAPPRATAETPRSASRSPAARKGATQDEPPAGDLRFAADLATPAAELADAIRRCAARATAKLRLSAPPFGDDRPPGPAAALLAAAVGGARGGEIPAALDVLRAVPQPRTGYDLVACHAVAAAALRHVGPALAGSLRLVSPLTGVLDFPADGRRHRCQALLRDRLLPHPDGRRLVTLVFAVPAAGPEQAEWRSTVLDDLRHDPLLVDLVLDVYEAAMTYFGPDHLDLLRRARRALAGGANGQDAIIAATWWRPLAGLDQARHARVLDRRALPQRIYRSGIDFYTRARRAGVVT